MNRNLPHLLEIEKAYSNVFIHQNVLNMAEIMTMCDIAVSACGSTMYELCACGLPIITYSVADNQLQGVKKFEESGIAVNCGNFRNNIDEVILKIIMEIWRFIQCNNLREKYSKRAYNLVMHM